MKQICKLLVCTVLLMVCGASAYDASAVPAKPGPITVTQPDGTTLTIRIYGDEFANYTTTDDGYGIKRAEDGFFYYIGASNVKARNASARTAADKAAMKNVRMGVPHAEIAAQRDATVARWSAMTPADDGPKKALGTAQTLILLVEFSNKAFTMADPHTHFDNFLNQDGYSTNGATGSVWNYYNDNSNGQFNPVFTASDVFTAPNANTWYAANDYRVPALVRSVLQDMASKGFNFAPYATGGVVNDVFMIFAGNNEAEGGTGIWPHQWYVNADGGTNVIGGYTFNKYGCTSEISGSGNTSLAGIGTFTHEYGHIIGLPDYYPTGYTSSVTPSYYFTMDAGSYNNSGRTPPSMSVVNRYLLGWLTPTTLDAPGNYELPAVADNAGYLIRVSGSGYNGEYFTLETRSASTNKWDNGLGHNGLLVMHIDRTSSYLSWWNNNTLNNTPSHPCARPVRASETSTLSRWVYPGSYNVTSLSESSNTNFKPWSGTHGYSLSNIAYANGKVTFTLSIDGVETRPFSGTVKNASGQNVSSGTVTMAMQNTTTGANSTTKLTPVSGSTVSAPISNGTFNIASLPADTGTYIVTVTGTGYETHSSVVVANKNGSTALVVDNAVNSGYTRKSWGGSYNTAVRYTSNGEMIIGAKFDHSDLTSGTAPVTIYGADYHFSSAPGNAYLQVYDGTGTTVLAEKQISSPKVGTPAYVDLTSENITVASGESVYIAYKFSSYSSYPAAMSSSTSNVAKGGLIKSSSGSAWSTGDANWLIGVHSGEMPATGITLDATTKRSFVGDQEPIGYTFVPEGTSAPLTWRSNNESVLTVGNDGTIKCLKAGTATVTVSSTAFSQTASCEVTVLDEIEGDLNIQVDNREKKAVVSWTPGVTRDRWILRWRPTSGTFTQIETTSTSVTLENLEWGVNYEVTVNGQRADNKIWGEKTGTFSCVKASAEGVTLVKTTLAPYVGDMQALEYKMVPEDGEASLVWSTSDASVVSVDQTGTIKPLKAGTATVTISSPDFDGTATCQITVSSEISGDITAEVDNLEKSAVVEWTPATTRAKWNYRLLLDGTEYKSGEVSAAKVEFTGLPGGAAEIYISGVRSDSEIWGETKATFSVSDQPAAESITINETEVALFVNETFELTATVMPDNAYNSEIEWSSSDSSVVEVDQNGLITAKAQGEAVITVKTVVGNVSASCSVTVEMEVAAVKSVTVYQNDAEFEWPGSNHEGSFKVQVLSGASVIFEQTVDNDTPYIYVPLLSPGTAYKIVVTAVSESANSSELEFTTEARAGKFAYMRGIQGTYASGASVPLRISDVQGDIKTIEWKVGGTAVSAPAIELAAGRNEVTVTITTTSNHKETITKIVNVQ